MRVSFRGSVFPYLGKVLDSSEVLCEMCHERDGEGNYMKYAMKYKMAALEWAGWPVDGGDKLSGRGQVTLTVAIGYVEEGLILTCHRPVLPSHNTHKLCNLSLCNS